MIQCRPLQCWTIPLSNKTGHVHDSERQLIQNLYFLEEIDAEVSSAHKHQPKTATEKCRNQRRRFHKRHSMKTRSFTSPKQNLLISEIRWNPLEWARHTSPHHSQTKHYVDNKQSGASRPSIPIPRVLEPKKPFTQPFGDSISQP